MQNIFPKAVGLYDPSNEHDNCGIGFVANIKGNTSHNIVQRGLEVLVNMTHRGAESSDNKSGDGAGIFLQVPHEFCCSLGFDIPEVGKYGTGLLFLPEDDIEALLCQDELEKNLKEEGLELIAYRDVPVDSSVIGEIAERTEPKIRQIFVKGNYEQNKLERKLYLTRKITENVIRKSELKSKESFYIPSLSSKIIIYKGMLTPAQVGQYFLDLQNPKLKSAIALTHSRFSTNTFPSWTLAQPFRIMAHNGEINTIKGNRLWMHARENLLKSDLFGDDLKKLFPILEPSMSDSASLDNVLEFLVLTGRSLPEALSMLIPESWNDKNPIPKSLKSYYEYHSTIMEPWDGPASIVFSDGRYIGGTLDRNGLRPSRYIITKNDMIVMGSEVGVQTFAPEEIKEKGRLKPGKLLLVDTKLGIIIPDEEIKSGLANKYPFENWLKENRIRLKDIDVKQRVKSSIDDYDKYLKTFGYSREDVNILIKPMSITGMEPITSMGNDTPVAALSDKPQRLFNYFRQLFAQVTNPSIDPIRESLVMALTNYIGASSRNILEYNQAHCRLIKFESPIVTNTDLGKIKDYRREEFSHSTISMLYPVAEGGDGMERVVDAMCTAAEKAVDEGMNFIILSDRNICSEQAPVPSLLAVAAVHHHLINKKKRMQVGIIVETGEAREIMHFALLLGFGASVINPYMAFATINEQVKKGDINLEYGLARENYIKAVNKGLLKILSKMGISTLRSYQGGQIFEAIGISDALINKYFTGVSSKIGGVGFNELAKEAQLFHNKAYDEIENAKEHLDSTGQYNFRKYGEKHGWNPETISMLQWSTQTGDYSKFKEFSKIVDEDNQEPLFLRGFLKLKKQKSIDINEVEPVESITKRFVTGAMSYGSISKEAHIAIAMAMNEIGGRSNTGEGGEDAGRFKSPARSAIKQVASGRFGVTGNYLINADELQIKIGQGAKPGEGGQLPGFKVDKVIAKLRNSTPGITLISPPPHHDIYSIEDLAQLIHDLKCANPAAKISVKLVSESGVGTIAAGVVKAHADLVVIAGAEGGTGASPASSVKYAGMPVEIGLAETQQTLVMNNLRARVKLQTDGQLKTGLDVVKMAILGAEEFGFATSALITLGCVMMRKCHLNTCPAGIATQDDKLRKRFIGKYKYTVNYMRFIAQEVREYLAELGFKSLDDIIGHTELLEQDKNVGNWKTSGIDMSKLLHFPKEGKIYPLHNTKAQKHGVDEVLDWQLVEESQPALLNQSKVWIAKNITNTDRSIGATLSGEISKRYGATGLPKNTINCKFNGSAGQSFGAFLARGIAFKLEGDTNDYLGKGLSGGKIIVVPPSGSTFKPEENIIIGNTVLYGATRGNIYIRGVAGERFCVRNSGAMAVVEGVGDHCCEYMTGGRVVVIGKTGRNFAAGMSGGIAYVLDENGDFNYFCNKGLVEIYSVGDADDVKELQYLLNKHLLHTNSEKAQDILVNWSKYLPKFVKVIPFEYKKVMQEKKIKELEQKLKDTEDAPYVNE